MTSKVNTNYDKNEFESIYVFIDDYIKSYPKSVCRMTLLPSCGGVGDSLRSLSLPKCPQSLTRIIRFIQIY